MAKNQNTYEKRRREIEKKRKAEEKLQRRRKKKDSPEGANTSQAQPTVDDTESLN